MKQEFVSLYNHKLVMLTVMLKLIIIYV